MESVKKKKHQTIVIIIISAGFGTLRIFQRKILATLRSHSTLFRPGHLTRNKRKIAHPPFFFPKADTVQFCQIISDFGSKNFF
jgi:hypothetical protein